MTDAVDKVATGGPEMVAYLLLRHICSIEGRPINPVEGEKSRLNRRLLLDTYAECLAATKGQRTTTPRPSAVGAPSSSFAPRFLRSGED